MRDLLLRLGQAAGDDLADVGKLDRFVRDRLLDGPRSDEVARSRWTRSGSRRCSWRFARRGVDVGADDPPARTAALDVRQVNILRLREAPRERRGFDAITVAQWRGGSLRGRGRSLDGRGWR